MLVTLSIASSGSAPSILKDGTGVIYRDGTMFTYAVTKGCFSLTFLN